MKKNLFLVVSLFFVIIFDILFFKLLPFYMRPNLFLGYIVFLALFFSHIDTIIWSFLGGVFLDFMYLRVFGINSIVFLITGYLIGWLNKRVDETRKGVQIIVLFLASLLYYLLYIFFSVILNLPTKIFPSIFSGVISTIIFSYLQLQILVSFCKLNKLIN